MFALVDNVESYPEFLPWCSGAIEHERDHASLRATLRLTRAGFTNSFTTLNTLTPHSSIEMELLDGPFDYLRGHWGFESDANGGCEVTLLLSYKFSNPFSGMLFSPVVESITSELIEAFADQARMLHG